MLLISNIGKQGSSSTDVGSSPSIDQNGSQDFNGGRYYATKGSGRHTRWLSGTQAGSAAQPTAPCPGAHLPRSGR